MRGVYSFEIKNIRYTGVKNKLSSRFRIYFDLFANVLEGNMRDFREYLGWIQQGFDTGGSAGFWGA